MDNAVFRRTPHIFPLALVKRTGITLRPYGRRGYTCFSDWNFLQGKQQSPLWKGLDESHESS